MTDQGDSNFEYYSDVYVQSSSDIINWNIKSLKHS